MQFTAPLPDDFQQVLTLLQGYNQAR